MRSRTHDHEIVVDTVTKRLNLLRDENGKVMYSVAEEVPQYRNPFIFTQSDWSGGHGQHTMGQLDKYFEGQSIDTTQPGRVFLGPLITEVQEVDDTVLDSAPVCFAWFAATSELLCATAGKIYRYNVASSGKWTAATTTVSGVTDLCEYNAVMYAARGSAADYYTSTDGITWTVCNLTNNDAQTFFNAPNPAGTANVLWKSEQPNELTSTTNGQAGGTQWSSPAYIGDTSNNITNIFMSGDRLLIGRTDGLFWYDSDGGVHPQMPDLITSRTTKNFQYISMWQGMAYFSLGNDVGEIDQNDQFALIGPLHDIDDISKSGTCVGLSSDKDFLYCAMDEGTNTIIYKGREISRPGIGLRWEWCPWVFLGTNGCATIKVVQHSATDRRLWFGYGTSGTTTGYVKIVDNPTADSGTFAPSGWIRTSYNYGTNPMWDKMEQTVVTETEACTANLTITPYYRKDADTSATQLTSDIVTNGVVETTLTSALSAKRIQGELRLATNSSATTPEVSIFELRGVEKPETTRIHECVYSIGDEPSRRAETIRTYLRGARTSTALIKFADLRFGEETDGTAGTDYHYVVMQPGYPREVEVLQEGNRQPELGIQCRWQEVDFA